MQPSAPRVVAFLVFDGAQSLDLAGPLEVFAQAAESAVRQGLPRPYEIQVLARHAGPVRTMSGLQVVADRAYGDVAGGIDTLVVSGGNVMPSASDAHLRAWLQAMAPGVRRLASVCSGSFILAEAGFLDGRCASTHWLGARLFRRRYPAVRLDDDAIFVRDGNVYTSAGVTAGIDMALALVEEDLGRPAALDIARRLVVFLKRPGGQSQFSAHLAAQEVGSTSMRGLTEWILDNLAEDLSNEALAGRAAMSLRNFGRVFLRECGVTPATFVEKARVDAARRLLEEGGGGLEEVAATCGFHSGEQMRRAFQRSLGVVPAEYRKRFRSGPVAPSPTPSAAGPPGAGARRGAARRANPR